MKLFKKKFKETKVGKFLKEKAPDILEGISDILPDKGILGIAGNIIDKINKSDKLTPEDKEMALKLLEMDVAEMEEVTKRWQSDMTSDSWLSKNSRPIILLYSWLLITIITILDACSIQLHVPYITLIETLAVAVNVAYFGSRGMEKYQGFRLKRGK